MRLPKSVQVRYFGDLITLTRLPTQTFSKSEIVSLCDVLYLLSCQTLGGVGLGGGDGVLLNQHVHFIMSGTILETQLVADVCYTKKKKRKEKKKKLVHHAVQSL